MIQLNRFLRKARILVIVSGCIRCQQYQKFIERLNSQIKPEKRIKIIDATMLRELGIYTNPLLKILDKYIDSFPTLFFEGRKIESTNTRIEAEAYIRSALHDDFIIPVTNRFISDRECKFIKRGVFGKRTLVCQGEEWN